MISGIVLSTSVFSFWRGRRNLVGLSERFLLTGVSLLLLFFCLNDIVELRVIVLVR